VKINLCLKCTQIHSAAELGPDPLGELIRSPDPVTAMGATSKGREQRGKERGPTSVGDGKEDRGNGQGDGNPPPNAR